MKRNLLMLLFVMLIGSVTSKGAVTFTVDIDDVESASVSVGSPLPPYGGATAEPLVAGENTLSGEPGTNCFVIPSDGFEPVVTLNGVAQDKGMRPFYQLPISEGMTVKIANSGDIIEAIDTYFYINNPGTATLTTNGETFDITSGTFAVKAGEYARIAPKEGYVIDSFSQYFIYDIVENTDGTIDFMPADNGYISLNTKPEGIDFNVNINVAANVIINAIDASNEDLGTVVLSGDRSPYSATAPLSATSLTFSAPEDGTIFSIKRIAADGTESTVNNSGQGGWRSALAFGDSFEIEAEGPQVDITFKGLDCETWSPMSLASAFVVKVGDNTVNFTEGAEEETVKVRIGDIVTVSAARGYELYAYNAISGVDCFNAITTSGAVQSVMITASGSVQLLAKQMTDMIVNIDNKDAVTVTGRNGDGKVVELVNGENKLESVQNPLKVTANEGYMITSVVLDGEAVSEENGGYTVELLKGSTLTITTREADKPFMVNLFTLNGDVDDLVITKDGEVVEYNPDLLVVTGDEITIAAKLGYIINSVWDTQGNKVTYNEKANTYTVKFTNGTNMISVEFVKAAENETFLGFECNNEFYYLVVYDKDGNRKYSVIDENTDNIYSGRTAKVEIGDQFRVSTLFRNYYITSIDVNGVVTEFEGEDVSVSDLIKVDGRTVVKVNVAEKERLISIAGSETIDAMTGSGIWIGTVFVNQIGQMSEEARPGDTVTLYPVAERGYKFDRFYNTDGVQEVPYPFEIEGPEADGSYHFVIPEDFDKENIYFHGVFVVDEENPVYLIWGESVYYGVGTDEDDLLMGIVRVDGKDHVLAAAGESVDLQFWMNIDEFDPEEYECKSFCLFNNPDAPFSYTVDPATGACTYIVNPDDVAFGNVIEISAKVGKIESVGVEGVVAESTMSFNAATSVLSSSSDVKVYNAAGQLVATFAAGENSLVDLPSGIYLLSNGVKTLKIAK